MPLNAFSARSTALADFHLDFMNQANFEVVLVVFGKVILFLLQNISV
jgi:hypothetical protein